MSSHIVIIGNGIAGVTTARHIRKMSAHKITIISAESEYFFSRTALMYVYMGHMKFEHTQPYENNFWEKNNINLLRAFVEKIDTTSQTLTTADAGTIHYDKLVLATGSKTNMFGWPGQDATGVLGLYSKQDLESLEILTPNLKSAVIVGGGLIGIELAEMLHSRNIPVTMLVRENSFWNTVLPKEESEMVNREIKRHHIDLRLGEEMENIQGNPVTSILSKSGEIIPANMVGITTGVAPNIDFLKSSGIETDRGVLVNRFLETNIENVYALGDCAQQREPLPGRKAIEAVWYTGRMMGEAAALTICGKRTEYNPGPWFNSAKFFNIEYMTYGDVAPVLSDNVAHFYWEHAEGNKSIRLAYDATSRKFLGVNLMGIRMRHVYFHDALLKNLSVDEVVKNLHAANFDPEFFKQYHKEIAVHFKQASTPQTFSV